MKKILILQVMLATTMLTACFEDKGNYSYGETEVITVTGINDSYTVETKTQALVISPNVESNKPSEWQYRWAYRDDAKLVTISETKDLSYTFELEAKSWQMIFIAKNLKTGIEKIVKSDLSLVTPYSRGWYVLKDDGANTDFNLYPSTTGYLPENNSAPRENVMAFENGNGMTGKAKKFRIASSYKLLNEEGSYVNTRAFLVTTEDDFGVFRVTNLVRELDRENVSFEPWPVFKPGMCTAGPVAFFLVNNGRLHAINTASYSTGRFGNPKQLNESNPDYFLSEYFGFDFQISIGFDEISSSFIGMGYYGDMVYCTNVAASDVNAQNNGLTCLYMGRSISSVIGVFADKTTGKRKVLKLNFSYSPTISLISDLTDSDKLNKALIITVSNDDEMMYFAGEDGNVYSRPLNTAGTESLELEVPNDETVTFIRQIRHRNSINYIAVATSKGDGTSATYTIRFFNKLGGRFDGEVEELRLSGKGYARDVNFNDPLMAHSNSYYNYIHL